MMELNQTFLEGLKRVGNGRDLDAAHEAYIGLRSHRDNAQISSGIWIVATNRRAKDANRRHFRWESIRDRSDAEPTDRFPDPGVECEIDERDQIIRTAVERLPDLQREVVRRRYWNGESIQNIAQSLGISHNTVNSRLRLAKDRLRTELESL